MRRPKIPSTVRNWIPGVVVSFLSLVLLTCSALPAFAQTGPSKPVSSSDPPLPSSDTNGSTGRKLKQEVDLVLANASVVDSYGRVVTGLDAGDFRIFEDGVEQEISHFSTEDVPVSIGIILDMSGSMRDKFEKSRLATIQFLKTANPRDQFFLVGFNDRAQLLTPFTDRVEDLQEPLMFMSAKGMTALFDGIYLGLTEMKDARNRKRALLIISDGGDNHSRYSEHDISKFLKEADVQIYAIGIYEPYGNCPTPEECWGPSLLTQLTEKSGGRMFRVDNLNELPDVATKISLELRNQYVIGFKPLKHAQDGKWHKIKIKLHPPRGLPPLTVYTRSGYTSGPPIATAR
jgi:Ca-activated chloride channel homolog